MSSSATSNDRFLRIAISGKSGCGNSTVSALVAKALGIELINYTFKTVAKERGISPEEVNRLAAEDTSWDIELDRRQVDMARTGSCVLASRLAVWKLEDADLKVYLTAPVKIRALRIQKREGGSFGDILATTIDRDQRDRERYLKLYNIDNDQYDFVDLVIDTSNKDTQTIASLIVDEVRRRVGNKPIVDT